MLSAHIVHHNERSDFRAPDISIGHELKSRSTTHVDQQETPLAPVSKSGPRIPTTTLHGNCRYAAELVILGVVNQQQCTYQSKQRH